MTEEDARAWVERYVSAWTTNDPSDIEALFTEDARYFSEPHAEPWTGREQIVERWLAAKDEPGTWTYRPGRVTVAGDLAFAEGEIDYADPPRTYSNLWVIRLGDGGRALEFVEWWMKHRAPATG